MPALEPGQTTKMTRKGRRPRHQECVKRLYGKCLLCDERRYDALHCHRVVPGEEGGAYRHGNTVVLCATHHALVTAGTIKIPKLYRGSSSFWTAEVIGEDGLTQWLPLKPAWLTADDGGAGQRP